MTQPKLTNAEELFCYYYTNFATWCDHKKAYALAFNRDLSVRKDRDICNHLGKKMLFRRSISKRITQFQRATLPNEMELLWQLKIALFQNKSWNAKIKAIDRYSERLDNLKRRFPELNFDRIFKDTARIYDRTIQTDDLLDPECNEEWNHDDLLQAASQHNDLPDEVKPVTGKDYVSPFPPTNTPEYWVWFKASVEGRLAEEKRQKELLENPPPQTAQTLASENAKTSPTPENQLASHTPHNQPLNKSAENNSLQPSDNQQQFLPGKDTPPAQITAENAPQNPPPQPQPAGITPPPPLPQNPFRARLKMHRKLTKKHKNRPENKLPRRSGTRITVRSRV
jgi:hypothetical protein